MKRSIKHLPKRTQEELNLFLELIKRHIPKCEMIILFGSYARGGYVLWDEKVEFGIHTSYQSDLDIMVVTAKGNVRIIEHKMQKITEKYHNALAYRRHASPQYIVENIHELNRNLERKQYFYTDIVKEGIKMYDTGTFELAKPRELLFKQIKEIAEYEFKIFYPDGETFLELGCSLFEKEKYKIGSFLLHQACERYYYALTLVFTNYRPKIHRLKELAVMVKEYSRELSTVFPQNTEFEKRCYDLLCRAYIEARYNKDFNVTKEELGYMLERTGILKEITYKLCTQQIASYDGLIK